MVFFIDSSWLEIKTDSIHFFYGREEKWSMKYKIKDKDIMKIDSLNNPIYWATILKLDSITFEYKPISYLSTGEIINIYKR